MVEATSTSSWPTFQYNRWPPLPAKSRLILRTSLLRRTSFSRRRLNQLLLLPFFTQGQPQTICSYDSIRPKCIKRLVFDSQLDQFPTQRQIVYFHQLFVFLSWLVICPWYCGMRKQPNKRSAGPRTRQLEVLLARHQVVFGEKLPNVSTAGAGVCL